MANRQVREDPDSNRVCQQCTAQNSSNDNTCGNRTCKFNLCWRHLARDFGLRVKQSRLIPGQNGLFATRPFATGDIICPYTGQELTRDEVEELYPGNTLAKYVACITGEDICVDATDTDSHVARYANDGGHVSNASFQDDGEMIWLEASREIGIDHEILADYGDEYWEDGDHRVRASD